MREAVSLRATLSTNDKHGGAGSLFSYCERHRDSEKQAAPMVSSCLEKFAHGFAIREPLLQPKLVVVCVCVIAPEAIYPMNQRKEKFPSVHSHIFFGGMTLVCALVFSAFLPWAAWLMLDLAGRFSASRAVAMGARRATSATCKPLTVFVEMASRGLNGLLSVCVYRCCV